MVTMISSMALDFCLVSSHPTPTPPSSGERKVNPLSVFNAGSHYASARPQCFLVLLSCYGQLNEPHANSWKLVSSSLYRNSNPLLKCNYITKRCSESTSCFRWSEKFQDLVDILHGMLKRVPKDNRTTRINNRCKSFEVFLALSDVIA